MSQQERNGHFERLTERAKSQAKKILKLLGEFALTLFGFIVIGYIFDLMLSESARASALNFQNTSLSFIHQFTPLELAALVARAMNSTAYPVDGFVLWKVVWWLFAVSARAFADLFTSSRWSLLIIGPACIGAIHAIVVAVKELIFEGKGPSGLGRLGIVAAAGPAAFCFYISLIGFALWALQLVAIFGLEVFGKVTELAGMFSVGGVLSFMGLKAAEKVIGERAEHLLKAAFKAMEHAWTKN